MRRPAEAAVAPAIVIRKLIDASYGDTVYRDLYIWRACTMLATILPRSEYARLKVSHLELDRAVRESRSAVICGQWQRVRELAIAVSGLKQRLDLQREAYTLASELYESAKIPLDPFLPGFEKLAGGLNKVAEILERLRRTLDDLEHLDPPWKEHYAVRRAYFETVVTNPRKRSEPVHTINLETAVLEALQMLDHGELDRLRRLAEDLINAPLEDSGAFTELERSRGEFDDALAAPLPPAVIPTARELGFAYVELEAIPEVAEYLRRNAFHPTFSDSERTEGGATRVLMAPNVDIAGIPGEIREMIGFFAMHPYVNSGGARYLPRLRQQPVLVEDFPEDVEPPPSPVLEALGLDRRHALSRMEIEAALLAHGAEILAHCFGLDPWHFRLLCIPFDVYVRVGRERTWGRRQQWTHFDGYQLSRTGPVRALVGGDMRYGGLYDLVSIGTDDQREQVIVRFAVVRRERLLSRLA